MDSRFGKSESSAEKSGMGDWKMKFSSIIRRAALLMLIASAPAAADPIYNFTFTSSGGMDATGTITVANGVGSVLAESGSINVTGVPIEASPSTLITVSAPLLPGSGGVENVENHNGDVVTYDNLVDFSNDPVLDGDGLGFGSGQYGPTHYNTLIGLNGGDVYGNLSPGLYTLFVGEAQLNLDGSVAVPEYVYYYDSGSLTITPVPEPATYALFGVLAVGCLAMRRRRSCRV
jgi:PEP-CTERM motif